MNEHEIKVWLDQALPRYENLTAGAISIIESLLRANSIDFLAVSGRTKTAESATEKLRRKGYKDPLSAVGVGSRGQPLT